MSEHDTETLNLAIGYAEELARADARAQGYRDNPLSGGWADDRAVWEVLLVAAPDTNQLEDWIEEEVINAYEQAYWAECELRDLTPEN